MLTPLAPLPSPCSMDHQFSTAVGPLALTSAAMRHHLHCCPLPLHPSASGDSKQSRQIIEGGAADKPAGDARAQGKAKLVCPAAAAAPPLKLAHHQSKSCSGRAGGAVHSGRRVSPRLCFCARCFCVSPCFCFCALCFLFFPAGLLSSHEHLLGCALDSNHKKSE